MVSSILFRCFSHQAHGARFKSLDRSICVDLFRVGYVDDTSNYVNQFLSDTPPTPETLVELLRHDSQLWSDLLWASGGALELPKCTYHYSHYRFASDGTPILQPGRIGPPVNIRTGDGLHVQTVPSSSVFKAYKTLGCYKSPSGVLSTQQQALEQKCARHARIVSTSALSRLEGWTYYFSKYLTSSGYPLPMCHVPLYPSPTRKVRENSPAYPHFKMRIQPVGRKSLTSDGRTVLELSGNTMPRIRRKSIAA